MNELHKLELIAAAAHMANRAYCLALGDSTQLPWGLAHEWQRTSAINGVRCALLEGVTPEGLHKSWLKEKAEAGWRYGPVKNMVTLEHPCFMSYAELPPAQQLKDSIFIDTVMVMAATMAWP